jgi:hypothetical protein
MRQAADRATDSFVWERRGMRAALIVVSLAFLPACSTALNDTAPATTGTLPPIASDPNEGATTTGATVAAEADPSSECDRAYLRFLTVMGTVNGSADQLRAIESELRAVGDGLPNGYADEVDTLATAYGAYGAALAEFDGDLAAAQQDAEAAQTIEAITTADVVSAYQEVAAYFDDNCPVVTEIS